MSPSGSLLLSDFEGCESQVIPTYTQIGEKKSSSGRWYHSHIALGTMSVTHCKYQPNTNILPILLAEDCLTYCWLNPQFNGKPNDKIE
jgi:hypothetical protein